MRRKPVIIAHDIRSNKRRRRIFRVLKQWKLPTQYSVFEYRLPSAEVREKLAASNK